MVRTQVYLTERQRNELAAIAESSGKKQSELVREAVDQFIDKAGCGHKEAVLQKAAGVWKNRKDLSDFGVMRRGWDRKRS